MFCKNCGKQIEDGSKFCPECGESQYGHQPSEPDSVQAQKKLIYYGTLASLAGIIIGIYIKQIHIVVVSALGFMVGAFKINELRKR
ncbi:putative membrane protein [Limihaloglobus sulfuriphilus]|uniref:Putative membrane protein n=1 Tax=Limihaloglobus sulfuriphilus TaxID=1851148 RepID=A0A1R7T660_9BACT|nr:zinc ribbon domain-containing protein [Limihaloglobus sulfuriphilus]AQQ72366.1 putative membrane protein [Limihaloglobus sulfuriphilus]